MVVSEPVYEKEYSCLVSDLVEGYPESTDYENGALMFAYDDNTKELNHVFKLSTPEGVKVWYKIV